MRKATSRGGLFFYLLRKYFINVGIFIYFEGLT